VIAADVQDRLNQQINDDYCSWYFYRSAAAHCREVNLHGFGKWLWRRSERKLDQATRLSDFLLERRGHVEAKPINSANGHWASPLGILDAALERERQLGQTVASLADLSLSRGDHATHDFLERVVSDQAEAEAKVEVIRDRLKMVGDAPAGLFMVDRDLA
jgi:ferritin